MRYWPFLILISITNFPEIKAQSTLLENVKQNPNEAIALCKKFKRLNDQGISASSKETINSIAKERNLSEIDAEILSTYVIGLNCPNVR